MNFVIKIKKNLNLILILLTVFIGIIIWQNLNLYQFFIVPGNEMFIQVMSTPPSTNVVAKNLDVPWSMDFLADKNIILTERSGQVKVVNPKTGEAKIILKLSDAVQMGESGLLGLALHPDFINNNYVYLYYTYQKGGNLINKVVRYKKDKDKLIEGKIILDNIPGAGFHDGGCIKFGPDEFLYITTGDATNPDNAQNINSLGGKILRIKDDGSIPSDNPFPNSPVYSYGHRNPEGLTWDNRGNLWETEHGSTAQDELNLIEPGNNYGWPLVTGSDYYNDIQPPVYNSKSDTWAPTGIAFYNDSLFFTGLRGQSIYKVGSLFTTPVLSFYLKNQFGRLRDIVIGPDQMFYVLTSNRDGRGSPSLGDDRIIKIDPALFR